MEPCGRIFTAEQHAQNLTAIDPYGNVWTVNAAGQVCTTAPASEANTYGQVVFQ